MESEVFIGMDNAEEMIRANGEAEAKEADRLREENGNYEKQIDELKALYLKNSELVDEMKKVCEQYQENVDALTVMQDSAESSTHKDCVRVYRNVQSALIAELDRQTKELQTSFYGLQQSLTNIDAEVKDLTEGQMRMEEEKKKNSPFSILTFVLVFLLASFEIADRLGFIAQLMVFLGI